MISTAISQCPVRTCFYCSGCACRRPIGGVRGGHLSAASANASADLSRRLTRGGREAARRADASYPSTAQVNPPRWPVYRAGVLKSQLYHEELILILNTREGYRGMGSSNTLLISTIRLPQLLSREIILTGSWEVMYRISGFAAN